MDQQELISHIAQVIASGTAIFMLALKYRELVGFVWQCLTVLAKPFACFWRWIKLARKLELEMAENKAGIDLGRKEIDDVKKSVMDLTNFVRDKLTKNGGSSIFDAIKRIEERQMASDSRQSALLNDSKSGYFFCDSHGKNTWVNRTYARFLDCGANELLGFSWKRFIKTDELARYTKVWSSAFNDGCEFEDTVNFTNAHGEKIGLHISVSIVQNEKGETTSYIGQVTAL
jgi:PAS domain S-box-containing protein